MPVGQPLERAEEPLNPTDDLINLAPQVNPQIDQHLVVARAAAVNLLTRLADPPREQQLDLRVQKCALNARHILRK